MSISREKPSNAATFTVMDRMAISDNAKLASFNVLLQEYLGGEQAVEIFVQSHIDGMTKSEIADIHRMPGSTVQDKLSVMRAKIKKCGLWREEWEETVLQKNPRKMMLQSNDG